MINDKQIEQSNASGSTGYQAGGSITVYGVSYTEARQIALDLWKANALELSQQAAQVALERATKLLESFLEGINKKNPGLFNALNDPGMQWALFSAQRDYARSGSEEIANLLVELLIDRAEQSERTVLQIALDESLSTIAKLTEEHLDILTLTFILKKAKINIEPTLSAWDTFLREYIKPFSMNTKLSSSCIEHLQYSNCVTVSSTAGRRIHGDIQIADLVKATYPLFFMKGFSDTDFTSVCGPIINYPQALFIPSLFSDGLIQFNYINTDEFYDNLRKLPDTYPPNAESSNHKRQVLLKYKSDKEMNADEVRAYLAAGWPFMYRLINHSSNYMFPLLNLTSVGIILAQANLKRYTGVTLPNIWIMFLS